MVRQAINDGNTTNGEAQGNPKPEAAQALNTQCVVYVTDGEYAFPTIMSALQARKQSSHSTDICVLLSEAIPDFAALRELLAAKGVILLDVSEALASSLGRLDLGHFQGRISVSTMAKLILPQILPKHYTQIIYLDGDTQVIRPLEDLEKLVAPPGKFYAARDYLALRDLLAHGRDSHYFNAGVLKFNREGWIGEEAFNLFLTNPEACDGKHDQGALNHVAGQSLILISNKWNFPKQFLHMVDMRSLSIVHYMAHPKPWHGTYFPWTDAESRIYRELRREDPLFARLYRGISLDRKLVYTLRSMRERTLHALAGGRKRNPLEYALTGNYPA